jgi:glycerol-3-phosphate O-acyltransferase
VALLVIGSLCEQLQDIHNFLREKNIARPSKLTLKQAEALVEHYHKRQLDTTLSEKDRNVAEVRPGSDRSSIRPSTDISTQPHPRTGRFA